jgi:hypothetical protein
MRRASLLISIPFMTFSSIFLRRMRMPGGWLQVWALFEHWVSYVVGGRSEILVALHWTDFAADDRAALGDGPWVGDALGVKNGAQACAQRPTQSLRRRGVGAALLRPCLLAFA